MIKPNFAEVERYALIATPKLFGPLSQDCAANVQRENVVIVALNFALAAIHGEPAARQVYAKWNRAQIGDCLAVASADCGLKLNKELMIAPVATYPIRRRRVGVCE